MTPLKFKGVALKVVKRNINVYSPQALKFGTQLSKGLNN